MNNKYRNEVEEKAKEKIDDICASLPAVVTRFERNIKQQTQPRTRLAYLRDIKTFLEFYSKYNKINVMNITVKQLEECNQDFFDDYINFLESYTKNGVKRTNHRSAIKRKLSALRKFYSYMFKNNLIKTNNTEKITMPKLNQKDIVYMDSDEVKNFLSLVNNGKITGSRMEEVYHDILGFRNTVIVSLLLTTGIRVSELVGLDINDVDQKNSCLNVVRKGNKEDHVYYPNDMKEMLEYYLEYRKRINIENQDETALFLSTRGSRLSVRSVENLVKKYGKSAVPLKNIHCHSTRSSFAMEFLKNSNGDIEGLQSALGHKNIATSQFYARSTQEMKKSKKEMVNFLKDQ